MRESCSECSWKHLCQAQIISHELAWYDGDEKDDHLDDLVGHLGEAGDQIQKESQFIADQIRSVRVLLMREGAASVRKLNIRNLLRLVREHMAESQQPKPGLGLEVDAEDLMGLDSTIRKSNGSA